MQQIVETAMRAARAAAGEMLSHWDHLNIDFKAINDLVTQADVAAERIIKEHIESAFPTHGIYAEESLERASLFSDHVWIVDPLDGTTNFANKIPHFSVSIAYAQKGEVQMGLVYDVVKDEMFHAIKGEGAFLNGAPISVSNKAAVNQSIICTGFAYERGPLMRATLAAVQRLFEANMRGLRRLGSAALDFCWVACGRLDGYFEYSLKPWDFAAGALILTEAGGRILSHTGTPFDLNATGAIVSCPDLFDEFVETVVFSSGGHTQ